MIAITNYAGYNFDDFADGYYLGLGDSTQAESASLTDLANEVIRVPFTSQTISATKKSVQAIFISPGTYVIREFGVWDAAVGGNLLLYHVLATTQAVSTGQFITFTAGLTIV